ncbi:MAG TPA: hypothetical protein VEB60_02515, partial [Candidatus Paceibacterota bacterium]|nr:hypothetical protein [Candidatus Paceibacterota bacterium]
VEVNPDQFSLAVGKGGQNVRLAAKLTSWHIDIVTPEGEKTAKPAIEETAIENNLETEVPTVTTEETPSEEAVA